MRRLAIALGVLALLASGADAKPKPSHSKAPAAAPAAVTAKAPERILGNPNAKITLVEYGSVACPTCAYVNNTVFPQIKAKYIDTGKVRYIFRPMLTGVPTIAVAGIRLAECANTDPKSNDRYYQVVDAVMKGQQEFYISGETDMWARPVLLKIAKSFGFSEDAYNKCVLDPAGLKALNAANQAAVTAGVHSTPTFMVNGKKIDGYQVANIEAAIAAAQ